MFLRNRLWLNHQVIQFIGEESPRAKNLKYIDMPNYHVMKYDVQENNVDKLPIIIIIYFRKPLP